MSKIPSCFLPVPVTILTGYLGSGKTTLLNRILHEKHGEKIAVIENEFGEAGIDNELLINSDEQIVTMNNGCICCTVRGDLVRILGDLSEKRKNGVLEFNRVIIETTGLADPAPVAQTFFVENDISHDYVLDAIITLVDAAHGQNQLTDHHEAQEQVGFADYILLSKTDLVTEDALSELKKRLKALNARAPISTVKFGVMDIKKILDIRSFSLDNILKIEPDFLSDVTHEHDDNITSFVFRSEKPLMIEKMEMFLNRMISLFGNDMLRYKGVLYIKNETSRVTLQGVHMIMHSSRGKVWKKNEVKESVLVFIGRKLPKDVFMIGLKDCLHQEISSQSHQA